MQYVWFMYNAWYIYNKATIELGLRKQPVAFTFLLHNIRLWMMLVIFSVRQPTQLGLPNWSAAFTSINNHRAATLLPLMLLWSNFQSATERWVRSLSHYKDDTWASLQLWSLANWLFAQWLNSSPRITSKITKDPHHWPFVVTSGDQWSLSQRASVGRVFPFHDEIPQSIPMLLALALSAAVSYATIVLNI